MMKIKLNPRELATLYGALFVARAQYMQDAKVTKATPRISEQFDHQAMECARLTEKISNEEDDEPPRLEARLVESTTSADKFQQLLNATVDIGAQIALDPESPDEVVVHYDGEDGRPKTMKLLWNNSTSVWATTR